MNFSEVMNVLAGLLQFIVAGYALRLNRLFGTVRVGWSLFCAFLLLAVLHLMQSIASFNTGAELMAKAEVMYSLISLLLLTGMVHIETLLKERGRLERAEQRLRGELELEVKKKTAHLTQTFKELQLEIDERRRMEAEVEKARMALLAASRQAEMSEIATSVLHHMGKMLEIVNVSTNLVSDRVKQSKIANVVHVGALIRKHEQDMGSFLKHDPRGRKLPLYIAQLAEYLADEQTTLSNELELLRKNINDILALQQKYAELAGVADLEKVTTLIEDARRMNAGTVTSHEVDNSSKEELQNQETSFVF
jgi:hypothetical protein